MNTRPTFTYIFRRWCEQENAAGQIVVIHSNNRLTDDQLLQSIRNVTDYDPDEFMQIELALDSSMVLDTWEREIDTCAPSGTKEPVHQRSPWWLKP